MERVDELGGGVRLLADFFVARHLTGPKRIEPFGPGAQSSACRVRKLPEEFASVHVHRDFGTPVLAHLARAEVCRDQGRSTRNASPVSHPKIERKAGNDH